jgi:hypothetical protein
MKVCRAGPSGLVGLCLSVRDLGLNGPAHLSSFICFGPLPETDRAGSAHFTALAVRDLERIRYIVVYIVGTLFQFVVRSNILIDMI